MGGMKFHLGSVITVIFAISVSVKGQLQDFSDGEFDVRQYLSTSSRYGAGKKAMNDDYQNPAAPPSGCTPILLNLVARHGTRAPTKKGIKELEQLSIRLEHLLRYADDTLTEETNGSQQIPSWLRGWQSPWDIKKTSGELTREGEEELYNLGTRLRERFPQIFDEDYHPDVYLISATQACNGTYFCPFEEFKERVAGPHLRHTFESLCTVKVTHADCPLTCRISRFFQWLFLRKGYKLHPSEDKDEL